MTDPMVGKTIDNYRILEVIGRGGMGIVFKAMDESLEKIVALKMIDPFLARDENFLRRFKREARALARLENPNIVTVYALRETNEGLFMVMEYVEAMTVSDWIRENGKFPWKDTVKYAKQMVDALKHAHSVGVIHRDIKPSNIMLTSDGKVKITDFGLAKVIRQHGRDSTVTQAAAGTLYYMSPEQVKGLKNVDFRSDLYSLGMTVYEMLVGRTPFEDADSDFSIQKKIVEGDIPAPSKLNDELPDPLVKIVQKVINSDPGKRYQSAEEMHTALEEFESSKAWDGPVKKKTGPVITKKTGIIAASVLAVVAIVTLFATGIIGLGGGGSSDGNFANISVETTPPDATVFVNDDSVGTSPVTNYYANAGETSLSIRRSGFEPIDTLVNVRRSRDASFEFTLDPIQEQVAASGEDAQQMLATLDVRSQPSGASIWVDGEYFGLSPLTKSLSPGSHEVRLTLEGYDEYSRNVSLNEGQSLDISATLNEIAGATGSLVVNSQPSGARIYRNNQQTRFTTPYTFNELPTGRENISLRLSGYSNFDTTVAINEGNTTVMNPALRSAMGDLNVTVMPFGSIMIDGELVSENSIRHSAELPAGQHTITAIHQTFGEWEKTVTIRADATQDIQFNFNQTFSVTVASTPPFSQIYVDGELYQGDGDEGEILTPGIVRLRPGRHVISVRKDGYALVGGERTIHIEEDRTDNPILFTLQEVQ